MNSRNCGDTCACNIVTIYIIVGCLVYRCKSLSSMVSQVASRDASANAQFYCCLFYLQGNILGAIIAKHNTVMSLPQKDFYILCVWYCFKQIHTQYHFHCAPISASKSGAGAHSCPLSMMLTWLDEWMDRFLSWNCSGRAAALKFLQNVNKKKFAWFEWTFKLFRTLVM